MAVVAFVSRTNTGSRPFSARMTDGTQLGMFRDVRSAQIPVEQAFAGKFLRWTRSDMPGGVEAYQAEDA